MVSYGCTAESQQQPTKGRMGHAQGWEGELDRRRWRRRSRQEFPHSSTLSVGQQLSPGKVLYEIDFLRRLLSVLVWGNLNCCVVLLYYSTRRLFATSPETERANKTHSMTSGKYVPSTLFGAGTAALHPYKNQAWHGWWPKDMTRII